MWKPPRNLPSAKPSAPPGPKRPPRLLLPRRQERHLLRPPSPPRAPFFQAFGGRTSPGGLGGGSAPRGLPRPPFPGRSRAAAPDASFERRGRRRRRLQLTRPAAKHAPKGARRGRGSRQRRPRRPWPENPARPRRERHSAGGPQSRPPGKRSPKGDSAHDNNRLFCCAPWSLAALAPGSLTGAPKQREGTIRPQAALTRAKPSASRPLYMHFASGCIWTFCQLPQPNPVAKRISSGLEVGGAASVTAAFVQSPLPRQEGQAPGCLPGRRPQRKWSGSSP